MDPVAVTLTSEPAPRRSDAQLVVDVALGIAGETVGAGMALLRTTASWPALRSRAVWRPALVSTRFQPASILMDVADRGAHHRAAVARRVARLLDHWAPVITEMVVARLDLNGLVTRHVDLEEVVGAVDLDAIAQRLDLDAVVGRLDLVAMVEQVLADIDLPAIIRDSTGSLASETVRGVRMTGISIDEAISRRLQRHVFRRRPASTVPADAP